MTEAIAIAADDVQARTVAETMLGLIADDGHVEVAQAELARLTGLIACVRLTGLASCVRRLRMRPRVTT